MKKLQISVLTENTSIDESFESEHGLSLFIKTDKHNILFDSGQSDMFLRNARRMGINIEDVDIMILSHGHYDHGGGIISFLSINKNAKIYINKNAFENFYHDLTTEKYIGIDKSIKKSERVILTDDMYIIDDELMLFTGNQILKGNISTNKDLSVEKNGVLTRDEFLHEQYLCITEDNKKTLVSGCSHKGITKICEYVKDIGISNIVGGFHLMSTDIQNDKEILDNTISNLLNFDYKYYTCHCTGVLQYEYLKTKMKNRLEYIKTGSEITI